jgi:hypothetical protein
MYKFGKRSQANLNTICVPIQEIAYEVLKTMDISCQSGERGELEQNELYKKKVSKLKFPASAHNQKLIIEDFVSGVKAGDFVPCPSYWSSIPELVRMRELFNFHAGKLGYKLKPMIIFKDGSGDYPHIEIDE